MFFTRPLARLIEEFQKFPGVGPKSAQRMAFHVLDLSAEDAQALTEAITEAKEKVKHCNTCFHLSAQDPCEICVDSRRDQQVVCVVADPKDVIAFERTREYRGQYHVLTGLISPLDGKGPDKLSIRQLLARLQNETIKEVIMAINPTVEGDATVLYLSQLIKPAGIKLSRIAFGLPMGSDLEYADDMTLSKSLEGRREI
ncbi:MAG: recombination mediator RecR [Candidatus Obscuribacterales bacterium]|nr:recombination mediator RecR [Candidatus Obscuribacterales bacterium]